MECILWQYVISIITSHLTKQRYKEKDKYPNYLSIFFINIFSTQELDLISKGAFPIENAPYVIDSELAVLMHQF